MLNRLGGSETAASRNKRQQLDHLLKVTVPHELVVLAGIGLLLLLVLAWALFSSLEDAVTTDCVLIKPGVRHDVVSAEPGQLLEYFVAPGEHVEAGAGIARQSVPELAREIAALRDRVHLLERDARVAGGSDDGLAALLNSARVAMLDRQALHSVRETIVAQNSGQVMALHSAPGSYLLARMPIAQIRSVSDTPTRVVLAVPPRLAQHVQPGMRASVKVAAYGDEELALSGKVMAIADGRLPHWLAGFLSASEATHQRIDIALDVASDLADGTACRARVILARRPPIALLGSGHF